jgi:Tol biopolymer transport system component
MRLFAVAQDEKPALAYHLTHVDTGEPFPSPDGKKIVFESKVAGTTSCSR